MATLEDVRSALFPAARPVGNPAPERLAAQVSWVRVLRARVPAFDALEAGDLAIVPVSALRLVAPGPAETTALVGALVRARVAGCCIVGEESASDEPDRSLTPSEALALAAANAGLPTFRLPEADPVALERSVIGLLVNRRAELEHQAARLEAQLERLALAGADLATLVGAIAGVLGRAVVLEGRTGTVLAAHAPPDRPEAVAAVHAYHARGEGIVLRVVLPGIEAPGVTAGARPGASRAGRPLERAARPDVAGSSASPGRGRRPEASSGTLVILGDRPATEFERVAAERIAGLLALEIVRGDAARRIAERERGAEGLPADGPPWVVLVARQGGSPDTTTALEAREAVRRELRLLAPLGRLVLRGDAESLELRAVLAADAADPGGLGLARQIADFLGRRVAVSRPFERPSERPVAEAEARSTLEAAESLEAAGAPPGPIVRADRLAAYRLLSVLHNLPEGRRHARALLAPLLGGRPAAVRERLATLRAVLETSGPAEAAAVLGVHRNTVAYRLRRIEGLTGWNLADPEIRLPLILAVYLVQSELTADTEPQPPGR